MSTKKIKKQSTGLISLLVAGLIIAGSYYFPQLTQEGGQSGQPSYYINDSRIDQETPSLDLASSVLIEEVHSQLGQDIEWNGAGSFIINGNQTNLNADVASAPYATNQTKEVKGQVVPTQANALLAKSTRQYRDRNETGQGQTDWRAGIRSTICRVPMTMPSTGATSWAMPSRVVCQALMPRPAILKILLFKQPGPIRQMSGILRDKIISKAKSEEPWIRISGSVIG